MSKPYTVPDRHPEYGIPIFGQMLVGPDDFECHLDPDCPEDCNWIRDGAAVVVRLNEQHAEIERLRALVAEYEGRDRAEEVQRGE